MICTFLADINSWSPDTIDVKYELTADTILNLKLIIEFVKADGIDIHLFSNQYLYLFLYRVTNTEYETAKVIKCNNNLKLPLITELDSLQIKYKIFL